MSVKDSYMTLAEVARHYNVTRQTISRWWKEGRLKGEKVGREVFFAKSDLTIKLCPTCHQIIQELMEKNKKESEQT